MSKKDKDFVFPKEVRGWLSPGEGKLLFDLAQLNPGLGKVVELGSYEGRSTICLAQGSKKVKGGKVFTADRFIGDSEFTGLGRDFYDQFGKNVESYRLAGDVVGIRGEAAEMAKDWQEPVRLLFIDTEHAYEGVKRGFVAWEKHLAPGGLVVFHDSRWPGVYKFIGELILSGRFHGWQTFQEPEPSGTSYAVKNLEGEVVPRLKRCRPFLEFKFFDGWLGFWGRSKHTVKSRGESDVWYRVLGSMANHWKKVAGK